MDVASLHCNKAKAKRNKIGDAAAASFGPGRQGRESEQLWPSLERESLLSLTSDEESSMIITKRTKTKKALKSYTESEDENEEWKE